MALYTVNYENGIGEHDIKFLTFQTIEEAKKELKRLKKEFEAKCEEADFKDLLDVKADTPTHYEATDGEDWVSIKVTSSL